MTPSVSKSEKESRRQKTSHPEGGDDLQMPVASIWLVARANGEVVSNDDPNLINKGLYGRDLAAGTTLIVLGLYREEEKIERELHRTIENAREQAIKTPGLAVEGRGKASLPVARAVVLSPGMMAPVRISALVGLLDSFAEVLQHVYSVVVTSEKQMESQHRRLSVQQAIELAKECLGQLDDSTVAEVFEAWAESTKLPGEFRDSLRREVENEHGAAREHSGELLQKIARDRERVLADFQAYVDTVAGLSGDEMIAAGHEIERLCEVNHCVLRRVGKDGQDVDGSEFTLRVGPKRKGREEIVVAVRLDEKTAEGDSLVCFPKVEVVRLEDLPAVLQEWVVTRWHARLLAKRLRGRNLNPDVRAKAGHARAAALSPEERSRQASEAARVRWERKKLGR